LHLSVMSHPYIYYPGFAQQLYSLVENVIKV